jgi:hypothetical protein
MRKKVPLGEATSGELSTFLLFPKLGKECPKCIYSGASRKKMLSTKMLIL